MNLNDQVRKQLLLPNRPFSKIFFATSLLLLVTAYGTACNEDARDDVWPFDSDTSEDVAEVDGAMMVTERTKVRDVGVNWDHVCAVLMDRTVKCWGAGSGGNDEIGADELRRANERVTPDGEFVEVEVGDGFACGLRREGEVVCWPQVQEYNRVDFEPPLERAAELKSGDSYMCFRRSDGDGVKCWSRKDGRETLALSEEPEEFAIGDTHLCGLYDPPLDDGRHKYEMMCRHLRAGSDYSPPSEVRVGFNFEEIAAGRHFVCGLQNDGVIQCHGWKSDEHEQVGWEYGERRQGPYAELEASYMMGCGIRKDTRALECWGKAARGDLVSDIPPLEIPEGSFERVVTGPVQGVCGIRPNHTLECFGASIPERLK